MPSIDFNVKSFIGFEQLYENFKQQRPQRQRKKERREEKNTEE